MAETDKKDVISECARQLEDIKTYFEFKKQEAKHIIMKLQNKLQQIVESHMYKGNCTQKEAEFLMSNIYI